MLRIQTFYRQIEILNLEQQSVVVNLSTIVAQKTPRLIQKLPGVKAPHASETVYKETLYFFVMVVNWPPKSCPVKK